ncbi:hypothetical protein F4780DRAFT_107735 [Xylariomycetidae sp. FL0641]|nr:hypothetical protein F4780DRAFT_107735 [Xylariomycetidae sp. FL0641]
MTPPSLQTSVSAPNFGSGTQKVDAAEQQEIESIWREINAKVVELAGGDPSKVQKTLDINSVLRYIDDVQQSDKKESERFGTFKHIVTRTLQCISTVGGIVTQGAATVFAPASMCYNALTFVIKAWHGYEGIFQNLSELLEKCVEFLERFESYEGRMDPRLRRLACQNLRLFVEICDRTAKLRKKHHRFVAFTKQLFLNDDGIQGLLGMMDKLNAKENLLVGAQTYRIVTDTAGELKGLREAQDKQKKEDDAKKWRRSIAKALGFPGTTLDADGEPIPTWQRAFDSRLNSLVDGTGFWWEDDRACSQWTQAAQVQNPVLVLEGRGGSGKTSMMANVIRRIRKGDFTLPKTRVVTAYYFAEGDKRKPDAEDTSSVLESVSRTLLWQIATSYEAMTKSVARIVDRSPINGSLELWRECFLENREFEAGNATFFIFIDGFHTEVAPLFDMFSKMRFQNARVFLTARPERLAQWVDPATPTNLCRIPISDRNQDDVAKYIISRMNSMPILRDEKRPGISEWRETVLAELREKCEGDYFKLNTSLNSLAKVDLVDDIREVLADAGKTRAAQIDAELGRLNTTRTVKEIQEINEIILWIDSGRRWLNIDTMEAMLSVKHKRTLTRLQAASAITSPVGAKFGPSTAEGMGNPKLSAALTISLLPFARKLVEKYTIFSISDSGAVDWRSSEIKDRVPIKGADRAVLLDQAHSAGPSVIQQAEINIVRHFLKNVCPGELYRRFDFERFFDAKIGAGSKDYVCLDPENAQIRIALTCLTILTDEQLRENRTIRQYSMLYLLDHLQKVDLAVADNNLKCQVGPLLVKLFTKDCGIDSMFWPFDTNVSQKTWLHEEYKHLRKTRAEWVYSSEGVEELARWFRDSCVTKYITSEPGKAMIQAAKGSGSLHEAFLVYAAKRIAVHLFLRIEFLKRHFSSACQFLRGYLARLDPKRSSGMFYDCRPYLDPSSETCAFWESETFKLEEVDEIESWAADALQTSSHTDTQESQWEIHCALIIFQLCKGESGAEDIYRSRAQKAIDLDPRNGHACHFIAGRPETGADEAIRLLQQAKQSCDEQCAAQPNWLDNHANSSVLARITFTLGTQLWDQGKDHDLAARSHRESLSYDYVHFRDYADVLRRYHDQQRWDLFIAFIETLNARSEMWTAYLDELVNEFVKHFVDNGFEMMVIAAESQGKWDVVEAFFTTAIDLGEKYEAQDLLFKLKHGFASTLALANNNIYEEKVISIRASAIEGIRHNPCDSIEHDLVDEMTNALAETYLRKAFEPNQSVKEVESYGNLLEGLLPENATVLGCWGMNVTFCCLIRYHHKRQTNAKIARDWIRRIVEAGLAFLSDDDDNNDEMGYQVLARLTTTVDDSHNARIAWNTRNQRQYAALLKYEEWVTTPMAPAPGSRADALNDGTVDPEISKAEGSASGTEGSSESPESSASSSSSEGTSNSEVPSKPGSLVECDSCHKRWTVTDVPLYTCADCVGELQLCPDCHALLMQDQVRERNFGCRRDHAFFQIPEWRPELYVDMSRGCVPLPDASGGRNWITLEEWRGWLKKLYLED